MLSVAWCSRLFLQQPLPLSSAAAPRSLLPDLHVCADVWRSSGCPDWEMKVMGTASEREEAGAHFPRQLPLPGFHWWFIGGSVRRVCYDRSQNAKGGKWAGFINVRINTGWQLLSLVGNSSLKTFISFNFLNFFFFLVIQTFITQGYCGMQVMERVETLLCTDRHVSNILLMQVLHHTARTDTILFGSGKSTDANSTWSAPRD